MMSPGATSLLVLQRGDDFEPRGAASGGDRRDDGAQKSERRDDRDERPRIDRRHLETEALAHGAYDQRRHRPAEWQRKDEGHEPERRRLDEHHPPHLAPRDADRAQDAYLAEPPDDRHRE